MLKVIAWYFNCIERDQTIGKTKCLLNLQIESLADFGNRDFLLGITVVFGNVSPPMCWKLNLCNCVGRA